MTSFASRLLVFAVLSSSTSVLANPPVTDLRDSHGQFTDHVYPVLQVRDVAASVAFYRDVLGFDFEGYRRGQDTVMEWSDETPPYWANVVVGGLRIGLQATDTRPGQPPRCAGHMDLQLQVLDLEAHYVRVLARNVSVLTTVCTTTGELFLFRVRDPDQNIILIRSSTPR